MSEDAAEIQVTLSRPHAVLLAAWLSGIDTSRALVSGTVPLDGLGAKLALDHLQRRLQKEPAVCRGQWQPALAAARSEVEARRADELHRLVELVLDRTLDLGARDDCAMDLGDFDDDEAFEALRRVAGDPAEDDLLLESAGESLGEMHRRHPRDGFDAEVLTPRARSAFEAVLTEATAPARSTHDRATARLSDAGAVAASCR